MCDKKRFFLRIFVNLCLLSIAGWGAARLYFELTDGFSVANIRSDRPHGLLDENSLLNPEEEQTVAAILNQRFRYFTKGCQSYVFASEDGQYVLKFLKYKHFRPDPWIGWFTFLPSIDQYLQKKWAEKQEKLAKFSEAWKIAYHQLQPETGVIYLHLNKSGHWQQEVMIIDKLGISHALPIDQFEFLIQRRAELLCKAIHRLMAENQIDYAKELIDNLLAMLISEHRRGLIDHDYALMQNTGVIGGNPIHIDVGQFEYDAGLKEADMAKQQLFDQTYKFRLWLKKNYPSLEQHLAARLYDQIGEALYRMTPRPKVKA